ncbi:hypothetical protein [Singulisphaera sp. PoT]|uniref:hypothetical protein n=1 Tax=Singulisphaera sp. PoT TaxID=3411797 RepID=UPI003BF58BAF
MDHDGLVVAAHHEAGHAIMALERGVGLISITLEPPSGGETRYDFEGELELDESNAETYLCLALAGSIAEAIYVHADEYAHDKSLEVLKAQNDSSNNSTDHAAVFSCTSVLLGIPIENVSIVHFFKFIPRIHSILTTAENSGLVNSIVNELLAKGHIAWDEFISR